MWSQTEIWKSEEIPEGFAEAELCIIYKKGDKNLHKNYRLIGILLTAYKALISRILSGKIRG